VGDAVDRELLGAERQERGAVGRLELRQRFLSYLGADPSRIPERNRNAER
jgi:hypothetical protein